MPDSDTDWPNRLLLEEGWQGDARMRLIVGGEVLPLALARSLAGHAGRAFLAPESEARKDVWDLAAFGLPGRLDFTRLRQPWLRESARRRAAGNLPRRRGIGGAPFHVVLFDDTEDENTRKIGILFEKPHHCAVLDVTKLARGSIAFGVNSYRGDRFEESLRHALKFPE